jgi:hypothetical protein
LDVAMMTRAALMAAVTAVAAQIAIPLPFFAGPLHPASSGGHPLRVPARSTLRGARASYLPAHRSRRRAGLRPVQGWARRVARSHGGIPVLLPDRRSRSGIRHLRCEERGPPAGSVDELALGMYRSCPHLRTRGDLARYDYTTSLRCCLGAGRLAVRSHKGGARRTRGDRRCPGHSILAGLMGSARWQARVP